MNWKPLNPRVRFCVLPDGAVRVHHPKKETLLSASEVYRFLQAWLLEQPLETGDVRERFVAEAQRTVCITKGKHRFLKTLVLNE